MNDRSESVNFNFPGSPYDVQKQLMSALYDAIDNRQVGLFESPTGTGKTLSIICATLAWLTRNRIAIPSETCSEEPDHNGDPPWVAEQTANQHAANARDALRRRACAYDLRLRRVSNHTGVSLAKKARSQGRRSFVDNKIDDMFSDLGSDSDEEFGCNDDNDQEAAVYKNKNNKRQSDNSTTNAIRIVFATRTHSQIAQFVSELRRTAYSPPTLAEMDNTKNRKGTEDIGNTLQNGPPLSIAVFGSRKQMCVNDTVQSLGHASAISERCRELTEGVDSGASSELRKRGKVRCTFHDDDAERALRDRLLIGTHDIEDAAQLGRSLGGCPYFATRSAVTSGEADVIIAPYAAVLHAPTRASLGLTIDHNTVVVFDEAHNVPATVRELHSCALSSSALNATMHALRAYTRKYKERLSATNLFRVRQALALIDGLAIVLKQDKSERVVRAEDLVFDAGVDNINIVALTSYMHESRLCKKLRGFVDDEVCEDSDTGANDNAGCSSLDERIRIARQSIATFERFVACLSESGNFGRVAIYPGAPSAPDGHLKYFVVEPGVLFEASIREAHAVLLVGGTLSPRAALTNGLLRNVRRGPIIEFECDHVVPAENVMARVCEAGPHGVGLEFTFRTRRSAQITDELGAALEQSIQGLRGGVIVFFASYELLAEVTRRWKEIGMWARLQSVKPAVLEVRGEDSALQDYQHLLKQNTELGAMLLAVMGGKLSEGINFADDLGRVVIMVGMPFGNPHQLETAEILRATDNVAQRSVLLENDCMTIINQCVGRAVRHRKDYAAIILMDRRYARNSVLDKLPRFIKRDLRRLPTFNNLLNDIKDFFARQDTIK